MGAESAGDVFEPWMNRTSPNVGSALAQKSTRSFEVHGVAAHKTRAASARG